MDWIKLTEENKPDKIDKYLCFVPDCKRYKKHSDFYDWNGVNFVDNTFLGDGKIVEASHYMILEEPV